MFDFKGFINSLIKRPEPGAVSNLKTATQFMAELGEGNLLRAQTEVTRALADLNKNTSVGVKERLRTVLYLDEKAHGIQTQLYADWLTAIEVEPERARQLLPTLNAYWQQQQLAFKACIRAYTKSPSRALEDGIKLITTRAMYSYFNEGFVQLVRYQPLEDRIWRNLHRLYTFAEKEKFGDVAMNLYPQEVGVASCMSIYLRLAMLHLSQPDRLPVGYLLSLNRWLGLHGDALKIEEQIRPHRQAYVVNLGTDTPPRRLRRTMVGDSYRYWSTDTLVEIVQDYLHQLTEGTNPVELGFGEGIRVAPCIQLMEGLSQRWSRDSEPMLRKHERKSMNRSITVAQGLRDVLQHLKGGLPRAATKPVDAPVFDYEFSGPATVSGQQAQDNLFESSLEDWMLENQSATGVGVTYSKSALKDLHVGTLIGLKADGEMHCAVGVVRRLQNNDEGKGYAGIETLSQTPLIVDFQEIDAGHDDRFEGLYLPELREPKQPRSLIIACDRYAAGKELRLAAQGKAYKIRLLPAIEETHDFARANFEVVGKG